VSQGFREGDELELELETARVRNLTSGKTLQGEMLSRDMLAIISAGGILPTLKARLTRLG
jgi:hypothetical protein